MKRAYYSRSIREFLETTPQEILGFLNQASEFSVELTQSDAWLREIEILQSTLAPLEGTIYFEYAIPRMGRRIDVVVLIGPAIFVLEFKVGEREFRLDALDQAVDYALDLRNFHEPSHNCEIAPGLIATRAEDLDCTVLPTRYESGLFQPIKTNPHLLGSVIQQVLGHAIGPKIDAAEWQAGDTARRQPSSKPHWPFMAGTQLPKSPGATQAP